MRYDGVYKTYKLYSLTEQDIALNGGAEESRYIKNSVLVFMPDIERPEIGMEIIAVKNIESAKDFIDKNENKEFVAQEIFAAAIQKSKDQEEERRRREVTEKEYIYDDIYDEIRKQ